MDLLTTSHLVGQFVLIVFLAREFVMEQVAHLPDSCHDAACKIVIAQMAYHQIPSPFPKFGRDFLVDACIADDGQFPALDRDINQDPGTSFGVLDAHFPEEPSCSVQDILRAQAFHIDPDFAGSLFLCINYGLLDSRCLFGCEEFGACHDDLFLSPEIHYRGCFSAFVGFEIALFLKTEHIGHDIARKTANVRIECLDCLVEFLAFHCYPVFRSF